jgi:hypothetical protein
MSFIICVSPNIIGMIRSKEMKQTAFMSVKEVKYLQIFGRQIITEETTWVA